MFALMPSRESNPRQLAVRFTDHKDNGAVSCIIGMGHSATLGLAIAKEIGHSAIKEDIK